MCACTPLRSHHRYCVCTNKTSACVNLSARKHKDVRVPIYWSYVGLRGWVCKGVCVRQLHVLISISAPLWLCVSVCASVSARGCLLCPCKSTTCASIPALGSSGSCKFMIRPTVLPLSNSIASMSSEVPNTTLRNTETNCSCALEYTHDVLVHAGTKPPVTIIHHIVSREHATLNLLTSCATVYL